MYLDLDCFWLHLLQYIFQGLLFLLLVLLIAKHILKNMVKSLSFEIIATVLFIYSFIVLLTHFLLFLVLLVLLFIHSFFSQFLLFFLFLLSLSFLYMVKKINNLEILWFEIALGLSIIHYIFEMLINDFIRENCVYVKSKCLLTF